MKFLRSEHSLEGREVLSVWLREAAQYIPVSAAALSTSVRKSGLGKTQDKREFLSSTSLDNYIKRDNCCRQSCVSIFLDKLPEKLSLELKSGIANVYG